MAGKMSRFRDAVLRVINRCKINNVYDCARPLLVLAGLFGAGGTWICHRSDGVYTLRNSKFSLVVCTFFSLIFSPYFLVYLTMLLFGDDDHSRPLFIGVGYIFLFLTTFLNRSTVGIGCIMTHVRCKRLDRMFQILHNIDSQLAEVNIRVSHWRITLIVTVLTLATANYPELLQNLNILAGRNYRLMLFLNYGSIIVTVISIDLFYMWTILFLLIIHERFSCINRILQENETLTNIHIVGARSLRDNHMLRRISLARHVHEQLTEVVQLFSGTCRYVVIGLTVLPILNIIYQLLDVLRLPVASSVNIHTLFIEIVRIVVLISICQANKSERRVLTARLRHLVAFETDREIIHQVQQYIMYNAHSVTGLIDFQFTDVDNVLLFAIIDIIASNALIIYSYFREKVSEAATKQY